jgi:hypothetical protein
VVVRADASQLSARADTTSTPPNDLTQALAVAGFLAVRYGDFNIDAHLILKSLAVLQLLVAAVALATRGVHTDRVRVQICNFQYSSLLIFCAVARNDCFALRVVLDTHCLLLSAPAPVLSSFT